MSVDLIRDNMKLDMLIEEESIQAMIEEDMLVPDTKPDVKKILSCDVKICIVDTEIKQGRVVIDGVVYYKILYVSEDMDKMYSIDTSTNFTQSIEMDNIDSTMKPMVNCTIEHVEHNILNERKIAVQTVVELNCRVYKKQEVNVVKDIKGISDMQSLSNKATYDMMVAMGGSQAIIRETYELDDEDAEMECILQACATVSVKEKRVADGKVIIGGEVKVTMIYMTEEAREPLHEVKHDIPFTHFVEMPGVEDGMDAKVKLNVDEIYASMKKDMNDENKVYDIEVVVKSRVVVYTKVDTELLTDLYSPTRKLDIQKHKMNYMKNICHNQSQAIVKETMDVPTAEPSMFKVITVKCRPVLTDYKVVDDKNIIEGFLHCTVIYIADSEDMEIVAMNQEVPFRHYVEMPGITEGMSANMTMDVDSVDYMMINSRQVEVKTIINIECDIEDQDEMEALVNVDDMGELEDDRASITIYFVQEGDTLWDIAKRYNTTTQDIIETNDIMNPEDLRVGDKIIIQKNYEYKF